MRRLAVVVLDPARELGAHGFGIAESELRRSSGQLVNGEEGWCPA
jgi:hypothetical protein